MLYVIIKSTRNKKVDSDSKLATVFVLGTLTIKSYC